MENEKRLIDANAVLKHFDGYGWGQECDAEIILDYIAEDAPTVDAVILPPVKIGDTAFFIINGTIHKAKICILQWYNHPRGVITEIRGDKIGGSVGASFSEWGKTVFATKEEAEAALAERKINDA